MQKQKKSTKGLTIEKENFSEWYSQVIEKAEITDIRNNLKGFIVIRPWGAMILENMYALYEKEMKARGHKPSFFPTLIPEKNFKKEASHVEGFSPNVFWLEKVKGEDKLALRPTSETSMYEMYSIWIRSWRDLPLKMYQRANVFRLETKATRPLIRAREFMWIEGHDCFETEKQAHKQVQEDIKITEKVLHQQFCVPSLPFKRPNWDHFPGSVYSIGSDVMMPDGKLLQQPSTHFLGQNFSKSFNIKFKNKEGKEEYVWQTCYGPAPSRMLASVIALHGDDKGLVLPFSIAPVQIVIIPIYGKDDKNKMIKESTKIKDTLEAEGIGVEIDDREKRPGEKYYEWELKGVPFRLEVGEKELKAKKLTLFTRDTGTKEKIPLASLSKIKKLGETYDKRLLTKANNFIKGKIVNCTTKAEVSKTLKEGKIARVNFCSIEKEGTKCADIVEREMIAEVRGTLANKEEKPSGKCPFCKEKAKVIAYIGKSY
ncbi:MAG: proline--tRNA ligase [Nanoarchaeota archaeon]|nr:proline--tRNA ligase [Nanoarchaeota archaeon]